MVSIMAAWACDKLNLSLLGLGGNIYRHGFRFYLCLYDNYDMYLTLKVM